MFYVLLAAGIALVVWNIITFVLYAIDKRRAAKKQWRISEFSLILYAFLMGGLGSLLGMFILRHKTKHLKFRVLLPIALVLNLVVIYLVLHFTGSLPWA